MYSNANPYTIFHSAEPVARNEILPHKSFQILKILCTYVFFKFLSKMLLLLFENKCWKLIWIREYQFMVNWILPSRYVTRLLESSESN